MDNTRRLPGTVRSPTSVAPIGRRDRLFIFACVVLITALAWTYLIHLDRQMSAARTYETAMAEMGMNSDAPWDSADVFITFAMWVVMMAGMMAGAAAPAILLFAGAHARRSPHGLPLAVVMFGFGYVLVWVGFSACAALVQWALHAARMLSPAMAASGPLLGGAILLGAGVYQLSPLKGTCLSHCRSPLGFLMANWRSGTAGAVRMGLGHGVYCVGCCWALMSVLFVVGVMNLLWVAAITVLVLIEKVGPAGATVARLGGAAMVVFGILRMGRIV
jgi:predicted metal-binding membrane protein